MSKNPAGQPTADQAKQMIYHDLPLTEVIQAAAKKNHWTADQTKYAEQRYRDFLWLYWNHLYSKGPEVYYLSRGADEVWHYHLIHSRKYQADCERMFGAGEYLHHTPQDTARPLNQTELDEATQAYSALGLAVPYDLVNQCMW